MDPEEKVQEEETEKGEVQLVETETAPANMHIDLSSPLPILQRQANLIIDSGIVTKLDTAGVMAIWATGHELGIPPMAALNNMNIIDGKPVLNKHIINTLVQKAGWTPVLTENFVSYQEGDVRTTYRFLFTAGIEKLRAERKKLVKEVTNEVALASINRDIDFQLSAYIRDFSFTWADATLMQLTNKSNWQKMPKIMMQTRCLTLGAREVAPEVLMGMYETSEMADVSGTPYVLDEEGNPIIEN